MTWWIWTLVSIGGYAVVGVLTGLFSCYMDGREEHEYSGDDLWAPAAFWPLAWVAFSVIGIEKIAKRLHAHGSTAEVRRVARASKKREKQARREARRAIEAFADDMGVTVDELMKKPISGQRPVAKRSTIPMG